jgi:hypothetical protein
MSLAADFSIYLETLLLATCLWTIGYDCVVLSIVAIQERGCGMCNMKGNVKMATSSNRWFCSLHLSSFRPRKNVA